MKNMMMWIYVFNESVTYVYFCSNYGKDITSFLIKMTHLCDHDDMILIVHDFSGLEIDVLSLYFDNIINNKHVIYDIFGRSGCPCMINCTILIEENHFEIITPFSLSCQDIMKKYQIDHDYKLMKCYEYYKNIFMKLYFQNLRRGKVWQLSQIDINKRVIRLNEINMLDHIHGTNMITLIKNDDSAKFMITMTDLFIQKCQELEPINF